MKKDYEISVVILNYKQKNLTKKAALNLLTQKGINLSIIIVDNNSLDGSYEYLHKTFENYDNIKVIYNNENSGYAQGNNFGVKKAIELFNPKYIGIMNPDVLLPKENTLNTVINFLNNNSDVSAATGFMFEMGKNLNLYNFAWKCPDKFDDIIMNIPILYRFFNPVKYKKLNVGKSGELFVDVIPGSFFVIRTQDFVKVNMFDEETFLYGEERILGRKIKNQGKKICVLPYIYYYHNHPYKKEGLKKKIKSYMILYKSRYYYNKKYNTLPNFVILPLLHISFLLGIIDFTLEQLLLKIILKFRG
ncbi:glycosyltransferase [Marinitoga sp. 1138]|uniref:glycosyltransferase n=1 Tax=Marinitoga sp. 1138 TaxID=1643334 RepID=UPI001586A23E|nr:glycosyltransferase family 2 protein [Marinitoga sp. 1138]NUU97767.1 hypothetical protein [Marinitoga sp. 1138]